MEGNIESIQRTGRSRLQSLNVSIIMIYTFIFHFHTFIFHTSSCPLVVAFERYTYPYPETRMRLGSRWPSNQWTNLTTLEVQGQVSLVARTLNLNKFSRHRKGAMLGTRAWSRTESRYSLEWEEISRNLISTFNATTFIIRSIHFILS